MAFNGYLIKATKNNKIFPHKYIEADTYTTVPNQREELKAYRDDNTRNLTRITASGMKTTIAFDTRAGLHLSEIQEIENFFKSNESDNIQRKINLQYWDNENFTYKTGTFYRANMTYEMKTIQSNDIIYNAVHFDLIEY